MKKKNKIIHGPRVAILTRRYFKRKLAALRLQYRYILEDEELRAEWEDTEEGMAYVFVENSELTDDQVLIQIDGDHTFWFVDESVDYMVCRDLREVKLEGDRLELIFHHAKKEVFLYNPQLEFYERQPCKI